MEFIKTENRDEFLYRETDDTGTYEIGICPVLYGFRVKGGKVNSVCYEINWCAGNEQEVIVGLFVCLKNIMKCRSVEQGFKGLLTHSDIKPFFKDAAFVEWLAHTVENTKPTAEWETRASIPDLHAAKNDYLKTVWTT